MKKILFLSILIITELSFAQKLPFKVPKDYKKLPPTALVETTIGNFEIQLYRRTAPFAVRNFEFLARKKIYNGSYFHRYRENKYIQGGKGVKTNYLLPPEISE